MKKKKKQKKTVCLFFVFTINDIKMDEIEGFLKSEHLIYYFYEHLLDLKDITGQLEFPKKLKFTSFSLANKSLENGNEEFILIMEFSKDKVLKVSFKEWLEFFHVKNLSLSVFQKHENLVNLRKHIFKNALVKFESVDSLKPITPEHMEFLETSALTPPECPF